MTSDVVIESAAGLDPAVCRRLILGSEPWITLQYGETDVRAIVQAAGRDRVLVARAGDRVVGFALSSAGMLLGEYLKILVVDEGYRSQGVGRRLMDALEEQAFRDWPNVYLCVSDFNHAAHAFYRRRGYEEIGLLKDLLLRGRGEILMRKSIGARRQVKA